MVRAAPHPAGHLQPTSEAAGRARNCPQRPQLPFIIDGGGHGFSERKHSICSSLPGDCACSFRHGRRSWRHTAPSFRSRMTACSTNNPADRIRSPWPRPDRHHSGRLHRPMRQRQWWRGRRFGSQCFPACGSVTRWTASWLARAGNQPDAGWRWLIAHQNAPAALIDIVAVTIGVGPITRATIGIACVSTGGISASSVGRAAVSRAAVAIASRAAVADRCGAG